MEYIIRKFNPEQGQIVVEYAGKWTYAIDLAVEDGNFPTGEKLEEAIQSMAPVWLVERKAALATVSNAQEIEALVQPLPPTPTSDPAVISESDVAFITQIVNDILVDKGL